MCVYFKEYKKKLCYANRKVRIKYRKAKEFPAPMTLIFAAPLHLKSFRHTIRNWNQPQIPRGIEFRHLPRCKPDLLVHYRLDHSCKTCGLFPSQIFQSAWLHSLQSVFWPKQLGNSVHMEDRHSPQYPFINLKTNS